MKPLSVEAEKSYYFKNCISNYKIVSYQKILAGKNNWQTPQGMYVCVCDNQPAVSSAEQCQIRICLKNKIPDINFLIASVLLNFIFFFKW